MFGSTNSHVFNLRSPTSGKPSAFCFLKYFFASCIVLQGYVHVVAKKYSNLFWNPNNRGWQRLHLNVQPYLDPIRSDYDPKTRLQSTLESAFQYSTTLRVQKYAPGISM